MLKFKIDIKRSVWLEKKFITWVLKKKIHEKEINLYVDSDLCYRTEFYRSEP